MMNPKVSVVVPNFNHAKYLKQRINSIMNQTYQDFELILLDDCSTDHSQDIIMGYKNDIHVSHIVLNENNSGNPFLQWMKGIELSLGEYVWIAESDDVADEDFLMTLIPLMERHSSSVVAFSHSYLIDENGLLLPGDYHGKSDPEEVKVYDGNHFARNIMTTCNYIYNASMVVFRKMPYFCIDCSFQQYRTCGDWAFWMSICLQGKVIEVGKRLSYFRQHHDKVTARAGQTGDDWRDVARLLNTFICLLHLKGLPLMIYRGQWTKHFLQSYYVDKQQIINAYPEVFGGSNVDIMLYRLSKAMKNFIRWSCRIDSTNGVRDVSHGDYHEVRAQIHSSSFLR